MYAITGNCTIPIPGVGEVHFPRSKLEALFRKCGYDIVNTVDTNTHALIVCSKHSKGVLKYRKAEKLKIPMHTDQEALFLLLDKGKITIAELLTYGSIKYE